MRLFSWENCLGTRSWGIVFRERGSLVFVYAPTSEHRAEWWQDEASSDEAGSQRTWGRTWGGFIRPFGVFVARWNLDLGRV